MSMLEMESTTTNTVNDDGNVTRISTTILPNGGTIVVTNIITAEEYQRISDDIQEQIDDLTKQKEAMKDNLNLIKIKIKPPLGDDQSNVG